jgi:branched-chain amino acid transport system permease protein
VARRRRAVLAVTAGLCGLSAAGSTLLLGLVSPADVSPLVSLELFVAVLVGGARWWGPVLGVAVLTAVPEVADAVARAAGIDEERSRGVLTAALLLAVVLARRPLGERFRRTGPGPGAPQPVPPPAGARTPAVTLRAEGVSVSYDGVLALDDVSVEVRAGEVHALVGPNGSGKTTLLKALAGDLRAGRVALDGLPLEGLGLHERVLAGVVRTPQQTAVMPHLRADRQVAVGARGGTRAPFQVLRHLVAAPSTRAGSQARAVEQALRLTGLAHVAGADPTRLSVGEQRLLQVARAVATGARVLLLDEPAAGMTADERARLRAVLRALAGNGYAVLLVEHDMRLVGEVADRVTVLDAGRVLASGPPAEVRADPAVHRAYLGAELEKETL